MSKKARTSSKEVLSADERKKLILVQSNIGYAEHLAKYAHLITSEDIKAHADHLVHLEREVELAYHAIAFLRDRSHYREERGIPIITLQSSGKKRDFWDESRAVVNLPELVDLNRAITSLDEFYFGGRFLYRKQMSTPEKGYGGPGDSIKEKFDLVLRTGFDQPNPGRDLVFLTDSIHKAFKGSFCDTWPKMIPAYDVHHCDLNDGKLRDHRARFLTSPLKALSHIFWVEKVED